MGAFSELLGIEKREDEIDDQDQGNDPGQHDIQGHGALLRLRVVENDEKKVNHAGPCHETGKLELEVHWLRPYSRSQAKAYQISMAKLPRPRAMKARSNMMVTIQLMGTQIPSPVENASYRIKSRYGLMRIKIKNA